MKSVQIIIPRKGFSEGKSKIQVEAFGYSGHACQSATEAFERALGCVSETTIKPEMYAQEEAVERIHEGG